MARKQRLVLDRAAKRLELSGSRQAERYDAADLAGIAELGELEILRLARHQLVRLPTGAQRRLHTLELSAMPLASLDGIELLTGLRRVTLSGLPKLDLARAFEQLAELPELVELRLDHFDVPPAITRLHSLLELHLGIYPTFDLAPALETLGAMPYLRKLALDLRGHEFPDAFSPLVQVRTLELRAFQRTMPPSIGDMTSLEDLQLYMNKYTALPPTIGKLANLRVLSAGDNALATLPDTLCDCTALERLDLMRNPLVALPDRIGELANLHTLHLQHTRIKTIPVSIGKLAKLRDLGIPATVKRIPEELLALELHTLDAPAALAKRFTLAPPPTPENTQYRLADPERIPADLGQPLELSLHFPTLAQPLTQLAKLTRLRTLRIDSSIDLDLVLPYVAHAPLRQMWIIGSYRTVPASIGALAVDWLNLMAPIETLPREFAALGNLDFLSLHDSAFTRLPAPVLELPALRRLVLGTRRLATLPALPALTSLSLRFVDNLAALPDGLAASTQLAKLVIELEEETKRPIGNLAVVGSLPALRTLELANLIVDPVPLVRALAGKTLDTLAIKGSTFTAALPPQLGELQVTHLDFEGSNIELPPELGACTSLRSITVSEDALANPSLKKMLPKGRWRKRAWRSQLTYTRTDLDD